MEVVGITCSTACKQVQSWACKLRTDSNGSRCSSWSWCSDRWGLSPLLKLSSASCRRVACLCASSSACLALSASMANRVAWARDSSASAFSAANDCERKQAEQMTCGPNWDLFLLFLQVTAHKLLFQGHARICMPHYLPTWAVCLQLWPHCFSVLWASSSSCLSLEVSAQGAEGSRVGGVPGDPWPDGKCSQILVLIPFRPTKKQIHIRKIMFCMRLFDHLNKNLQT